MSSLPLPIRVRRRLAKGVFDAAGRALPLVRQFDPLENLILCSDPRGGSTWLGEVIGCVPGTATLWEPLDIAAVPRAAALGFGWRQHVDEADDWPSAEQFFGDVFAGRVLNGWTLRATTPVEWLRAERMVVKFCRATALLPWLTRRFAFRYRPVHLVRHPFAVVASQLAYGAWDAPFTGFEQPVGPHTALWDAHADYLATLTTQAEALTATWALTNGVALGHPRAGTDWTTVHYERLVMDPEPEIARVFDAWDLPVPAAAAEQVHRASATTKTATFQQGPQAQLAKWQRHLDPADQDRMMAVLDHFGVTIYGRDVLPTL
ncbi:sulfotransferase [Rubrivirga sp. IMCC45206]|uniref:sulfotransferase n=1 Tax=Rubrivirga sp. IMCC45206 TaxID=3391614 RepID=UPI00398F999D